MQELRTEKTVGKKSGNQDFHTVFLFECDTREFTEELSSEYMTRDAFRPVWQTRAKLMRLN
jgi:hypothetical protein